MNAMIVLDTLAPKSSTKFKYSEKNANLFFFLWDFEFLFSHSLAPDFSFLFFFRVQITIFHCSSEAKEKEITLPKIAASANIDVTVFLCRVFLRILDH